MLGDRSGVRPDSLPAAPSEAVRCCVCRRAEGGEQCASTALKARTHALSEAGIIAPPAASGAPDLGDDGIVCKFGTIAGLLGASGRLIGPVWVGISRRTKNLL